jgi:glycosyltransferase involved in cell wall biosynthesis
MKPKLLIIHNRLVVGGPALDLIPLAHHLQNDFDIHFLYGCKEKDETEPSFLLEKYKGVQLIKISSLQRSLFPFRDIKAYFAILKHIREFQPDIVHTHGAKIGLLGRLAAHKAKVPLLVHTFHGHLFHSYFNRFFTALLIRLERQLLKITNLIIAISETQKKELEEILQIKNEKQICLVPLGVDYIDVNAKEHYMQAFKRTYQVKPGTICIGILGRMVPIKNPIFFLKVAENVLRNHAGKSFRFFVVGEGSELQSMKHYLKQKAVPFTEQNEDCPIVFTSWIQNIQNVLEGLDIVVLTSFNEGTPLSLIEAQLCGKPVVAADVGGVRDTMIDGETGILIQDHDIQQFTNAIIRLANDAELRSRMGEKGREFASVSFSKTKEIERMREIYMLAKSGNIAAGHE